MRHSTIFAALLLIPLAVMAGDPFGDQKVSWRQSWPGGTASDRLAAVESMATFGTVASTRILLSAVPLVQEKIDFLLEERELLRSGRHPDVKVRNPAGYLREVKERLDAEYAIVEAIEQALGKLRDEAAITYLSKTALFREKFWKTRAVVARTLGLIGDRVLIEALGRAIKDRDPRVRASVLVSLGATRAEEATKQILKALTDKDWMVRSAAVDALSKIRDPDAFETLLDMMIREEGLLAEQCAEALENITGESFGRSADLWKKWWAENKEKAYAGIRGEKPKPEPKKSPDDRYYHAIPIKSKRTIFILDVSDSMSYSNEEYQEKPKPGEQSRLDLAKKELISTLRVYQRKGTFGLIAFHTVVKVWRPRIVPASKPMTEDAIEWIEDLEPTGTTNVYGALEAAFRMAGMGIVDKYYPPAADTIFLLSDGAPTNRDLSEDDSERIFRAVRQWNRLGRMKIHTIGLKGHSQPFMERLARENGGTYVGRD